MRGRSLVAWAAALIAPEGASQASAVGKRLVRSTVSHPEHSPRVPRQQRPQLSFLSALEVPCGRATVRRKRLDAPAWHSDDDEVRWARQRLSVRCRDGRPKRGMVEREVRRRGRELTSRVHPYTAARLIVRLRKPVKMRRLETQKSTKRGSKRPAR